MDENIKIAYAEVFEILGYMDRKIILKIPIEIAQYINKNKKENYISRIDKNDIFNKNNIKRETLSILTWLNINYWSDEEKKKQLITKYRQNDIKYEMKVKEQYKEQELFKNKKKEEYKEIVVIKKENIFRKIINKIKEFFRNEKR